MESDFPQANTARSRSFAENNFVFAAVFQIWIHMDPHKKMPPGYGSGSAWTEVDPDPDPGGKKA